MRASSTLWKYCPSDLKRAPNELYSLTCCFHPKVADLTHAPKDKKLVLSRYFLLGVKVFYIVVL